MSFTIIICGIGIVVSIGLGFFIGRMYENMRIRNEIFAINDKYEKKKKILQAQLNEIREKKCQPPTTKV